MTATLSLYQIDLELITLMQAREELLEDVSLTPVEIEDAVRAVDAQIAEYLPQALQNRADAIANVFRQWDAMDACDAAEMERLKQRKRERANACQYLEQQVLGLMKRAGVKRIDGQNLTLKVAKNPASCEVAQPALVPDAYKRAQVTLTLDLYNRLLNCLMTTEKGAPLFVELTECKITAGEPMLAKIKDELKAGVGVPGCRLVDDKVRLEIK